MKRNYSAVIKPRKKLLSFVLAAGIGVFSALPGVADARLIFTTEEDGVNSEEYHFDIMILLQTTSTWPSGQE